MEQASSEYHYIWEYRVRADRIDQFHDLYGPEGGWVQLFKLSPGYIDTLLLQDRDDPTRFVTIDSWRSYQAWRNWRTHVEHEFQELERRGEEMTLAEHHVGDFEIRPDQPRAADAGRYRPKNR